MEKKKKLKEPKVFTVESAKQTIPFVKRIVADIMESSRELRNIEKSLRLLNPLQKRKSIIDRKEELLKNQEEYYKELDLVGCHIKNALLGVVAYYWDRGDGLIVELCWRYGDDEIMYWNEIGSEKIIPIA